MPQATWLIRDCDDSDCKLKLSKPLHCLHRVLLFLAMTFSTYNMRREGKCSSFETTATAHIVMQWGRALNLEQLTCIQCYLATDKICVASVQASVSTSRTTYNQRNEIKKFLICKNTILCLFMSESFNPIKF